MTATALAAVGGIAAPATTAVAAPAGEVSTAAGIGTSEEQRVTAASVVGLDVTNNPEVLLLSDRDFIFALWEKANGAGADQEAVRQAAEEVMSPDATAEDHIRFITTGIREANELDQQRKQDRAAIEREAREAKARVLIALGIPSSPELLGLSDDNFIRQVMKHAAAGPEVRAAAARALAEDDAAVWQEFIGNGAREAHKRDRENELKELEEKDRQEAQRRKEQSARENTAALFGITPSEAMMRLSDDNFIRELIRLTPAGAQGTELFAAAQKALNSSATADWSAFLHTGAEQAFKRDDDNRRKKIAQANRELATRIQAAAQKTGVRPHLVAAAKKALAGSDADVAAFLREDSLYRAKRQSLAPSSAKLSGWYVRQSSVDGGEAFLAPVDAKGKQSDREDATWVVVDGLAAQPGCYSFKSPTKAGHYLTLNGLKVKMAADDGSAKFRKDATWCARKALTGSGTSFESAGNKGRYLRHFWGDLYAAKKDDKSGHRFDRSKDFAQDATWKISTPLAR
ncbi:AbfB domain-containing protein [Streptomyces sp. NBRC 110611]|uniref:AbfB domain-containing protein n=1 Tax=Streptomyces sp. NBRC 110611 TaxID=1621259 RepID=UPI00215D251A|nr:AbfB domain-containing protein [Streptomyces sp. NBRC 110611]